ISFLVYSFDSRATRAAASLSWSRKLTCGVVGETIAVAMPARSMSSSDFCGDQLTIGGVSRLAFFTPASQDGGGTRGGPSVRWGLARARGLRPRGGTAAAPHA